MKTIIALTALILGLFTTSHAQKWHVNTNQSKVYFSSIKNSQIAETHHFSSINGTINTQGHLNIDIDLDSLETAIPIRNTRMKDFFFETQKYPKANISADNLPSVDSLTKSNEPFHVQAKLSLHGQENLIDLYVRAIQVNKDTLRVYSEKPTFISVEPFKLNSGLKKLQEIAKLKHISAAVPVTFVIDFVQSK